ncbi:MAG: lipopolysaccharide heptosyltransferase [Pedosphaera sp.]|nr:lipopolysaccharide heptosyltransferase [Pedosphaera sp.]
MRTLILSRPDRVGDVVISTACLAPIREKFPHAKIHFVAAERMRPLLEGHPLLAGFIPLTANLTSEFQRLNASAIVHLHPDPDCYAAAARAKIPVRVGYAIPLLNRHLTHKIKDQRRAGVKHEAEYIFDLLSVLEVSPPSKLSQNVHLPEAALVSLQSKLPWPLASTPFAVVNPTAHSKIARWPVKYFLELAGRIESEFGLLPVFIGADAHDSIPSGSSPHLNLAGKTHLGELGWLLRHARVLVTVATGPSHLAAAVGCPVVAIFGRTVPPHGPARWRPLSEKAIVIASTFARKRLEDRDAYWRRCYAAIGVDEVAAAVRQSLNQYRIKSCS